MAKSTYSTKLLDPRWQKKRLEVLERDGWECSCCGDSDRTLHVHHAYYVSGREPWEYPPETLLTLCEDCHKVEDKDALIEQIEDLLGVVKSRAPAGASLTDSLWDIFFSLGCVTAEVGGCGQITKEQWSQLMSEINRQMSGFVVRSDEFTAVPRESPDE